MSETVRLPLSWAPAWFPFGLLIGGLPSRCWVEVGDTEVAASFGPLGQARFPKGAVQEARAVKWPWWRGFGVRWYGAGAVGFVGRSRGVVELTLQPPQQVNAVLTRRASRLALSPSDPAQLLGLLGFPYEDA